jgi:hypothetical protein
MLIHQIPLYELKPTLLAENRVQCWVCNPKFQWTKWAQGWGNCWMKQTSGFETLLYSICLLVQLFFHPLHLLTKQ